MMESLNRPIRASTAFGPPIFATPQPAWARTDQKSSLQAPISASSVAGSPRSARVFAASSRVASSTSSSASKRSASTLAIVRFLLVIGVALPAMGVHAFAQYHQCLRSAAFDTLIQGFRKIERVVEIHSKGKIERKADELVFAGL